MIYYCLLFFLFSHLFNQLYNNNNNNITNDCCTIDRKSNILLEKLLKRASEYDVSVKNRSQQVPDSSKQQLSSSDDDDETTENESKIIADCKLALEQTQALRMANPQLLRPEDYVRLMRLNSFLLNEINRSFTTPPTPPFPITSDAKNSNEEEEKDGDDDDYYDGCNDEEFMVNNRCSCYDISNDNNNLNLVNRVKKCTYESSLLGANGQMPVASKFELNIKAKGFCSYVAFVISYVIFLFMITLLLSRIGKI